MEVRDLLFRQIGNPLRDRDALAMIQVSGRKIGSSSSGDVVYYVLDGMVYAVLASAPLMMRMDYFEFCDLLRQTPMPSVYLDFRPEGDFHLGKRDTEPMAGEGSKPMAWPPGASEPGQAQSMGIDPGAATGSWSDVGQVSTDYPPPTDQRLYELMYASGGHGGPIAGLEAATDRAKAVCVGIKEMVYIVPRDHRALHPRNAVRRVKMHPTGGSLVEVEDA